MLQGVEYQNYNKYEKRKWSLIWENVSIVKNIQ